MRFLLKKKIRYLPSYVLLKHHMINMLKRFKYMRIDLYVLKIHWYGALLKYNCVKEAVFININL